MHTMTCHANWLNCFTILSFRFFIYKIRVGPNYLLSTSGHDSFFKQGMSRHCRPDETDTQAASGQTTPRGSCSRVFLQFCHIPGARKTAQPPQSIFVSPVSCPHCLCLIWQPSLLQCFCHSILSRPKSFLLLVV